MFRQVLSLENWTLILLAFLAVSPLALAACTPETLVVGLEPTPTPAVESYVNDEYGFAFRYPETWTLAEEPHTVRLSQGTLTLRIAYGWASDPGFSPVDGRTGAPAGDFIYGDKVFFLEQVIPAQVLEYERKDKMVFYGGPGLVEVEDLVFSIWLEDVDGANYSELDIPKELQAEVKEILESFERIEATSEPPTPAPTPTLVVEKDLVTYVNDDYRLAFIYPPSWELEEIPAGQEVPGGTSANAVHLTRDALRLAIQFKRVEEETVLGPGGRPAGEIEERGTVMLVGREVVKEVLVSEGKVKSVFLSDQFDDLELYVQLDDGVGAQVDYETVDIPAAAQSEMDAILGSLTRTGEAKSTGADVLTYESAAHGFSFQYPAAWTVEEVVGEMMDDGTKLADAVVLTQGKFKIIVQHQRKSDPAPTAWGGSLMPGGLGYSESTLGDPVTVLGEDTHKLIWTYNGAIKAVAVNTTGKGSDLVLSITLADGSVALIQDAETETVPGSAIAALDRVVSSFTATR